MTEKYKIYLSEDIKSRLYNDAELFEFFKKDGSVNLNAFLKILLVNYFDRYRHGKEDQVSRIKQDILNNTNTSDEDAEILAYKIANTYIDEYEGNPERGTVITLTVSGESYETIGIIESNLLKDCSLSQYLRNMFLSYLAIPRNRREEIIYKDIYELITTAIERRQILTFSTSVLDSGSSFSVEPYFIAPSREEQCGYLICKDLAADKPRSFRISRLTKVFVTKNTFSPDLTLQNSLYEQSLRSPQAVTSSVQTVVRMTSNGIRKFHLITKNRPDVLKTDGELYYFDWPELQLEEYFKRFGEDAIVIEPLSLRSKLKKYYDKAAAAYID